MKRSKTVMLSMTLCLFCAVGSNVLPSLAATNFNRSTVVGIDQAQRSITFRTTEGQTWTLPVVDPSMLKNEQLAKGDQVSIEIDLDDRITKIVKTSGQSQSEHMQPQHDSDDAKP